MKKIAFISYSMKDSEQYVLTLLSSLLKEEGFSVDSSFDFLKLGDSIDYSIKRKIQESSLFIGVITQPNRNDSVLNEWKQAQTFEIPSILLIEDEIDIDSSILKQVNVLRFNRYSPDTAIKKVVNNIKKAETNLEVNKGNSLLGWILGGLAILAILKLLSDD